MTRAKPIGTHLGMLSAFVAATVMTASGQSLIWLGRPLGVNSEVLPVAVSRDGTLVAAASAHYWQGGEWAALPVGNVSSVQIGCMSANGSLYGGSYVPPRGQGAQGRAFVLSGTTRQDVHPAPSGLVDMSADGSVLLGTAELQVGERAFVRIGSSVIYIQPPTYFLSTTPYGISPDGSVAVGYAFYTPGGGSAGETRAFRWSNATGAQILPQLAGANYSRAHAASLNGDVIVGVSFVNGVAKMTRWQGGSVQDLGTLSGYYYTEATDVSELGNIAVGFAYDGTNYRAVIWTTSQGLQNMNTRYASLLSPGSYLMTASAISHNGRYVVGLGYNAQTQRTEPYLLATGLDDSCLRPEGDVDGNGCVNDADLLQVLFSFGQSSGNLGRLDQNCDRRVDDADLLIVLFNFGRGCR